MKKLILLRHAKSSWANVGMADFDRPLNPRGIRNAPFMAELLYKLNDGRLDGIAYSPAARTTATMREVANKFGLKGEQLLPCPNIYEAMPEDVLEQIETLPNEWESVLLVGHNPGLTLLANHFIPRLIDNLPTCGAVGLQFPDLSDWSAIAKAKVNLLWVEYPKKYKQTDLGDDD